MSSLTWLNSDPASSSTASFLDDAIRSFQSAVAAGLGESLNWPGTGGGSTTSAGRPKLGSARVRYDAAPSAGIAVAGHLGVSSTRGLLQHLDSTAFYVLGGASMLENVNATLVSAASLVWQAEQGTSDETTATASSYVFASAYSADPVLVVTSDRKDFVVNVSALNTSGFSSTVSRLTSSLTYTLSWYAEGYRST